MSGAVVLMYHRIGAGALAGREAGEEIYAVTAEEFDIQLDALSSSRCAVLPFGEVVTSHALPSRAVAITFDDGNATDHTEALPRLLARGFRAAFFVTPAWVGCDGYLDWSQVRDLVAAGMTVGAHGLDHTFLASLDDEGLRRHLREARRMMEARLGRAPETMSLPGGAGDGRVLAAAREEGFRWVANSAPRRQTPGRAEDYVPRFAVRCTDSLPGFRSLVEQRSFALLRHSFRYRLVSGLRAAVGEALYQRARRAWAGEVAAR